MLPLAAAAGMGIAGGIAEGVISSAFNASQAAKNRSFQSDMSNTAHQREVADLRAAGLNPILSASKGGPGASSPSGSSAQAVKSDAVHSGISSALARAQIEDINSGIALKGAQTKLAREERALKAGQGMALQAEIDSVIPRTQQFSADLERTRADIRRSRLESTHSALDLDRSRRESEFHRGLGGKLSPYMRFNPLGNTGINFLRLKTK